MQCELSLCPAASCQKVFLELLVPHEQLVVRSNEIHKIGQQEALQCRIQQTAMLKGYVIA